MSARRRLGAILLVLAAGLRAAFAADPPLGEPLAVEASALVPIDSEISLKVSGLAGQINVTTRDDRELRVVSRRAKDGSELPVGIWQAGTRLIVAPAPGQAVESRTIRIEVPSSFDVSIDIDGSDVILAGVGGALELDGDGSRFNVQGCAGISADVTGGTLTLSSSGDTTVRSHGAAVTTSDMTGALSLHLVGGTAALAKSRGSIDIESEDSTVTVDDATAPVRVTAGKGGVVVKGMTAGGDFQLTGASLRLVEGKGDVTVQSDASVEFASMDAALHFDLYGGNLRGKDNKGILEVRTRNSEINIEGIDQSVRISGDGIHGRVVDVAGEVYVEASVSDFVIDKPGSADLHIDRGNLTVQRAAGLVKATVVGGDVHLLDGIGPVQLDVDGGDAEISWASISADKDTQIVNRSGSVTVRLPGNPCRIEARTKYGRIDSIIPTIRVSDDEKDAQGPVFNGSRPVIHILAQQDIHLLDASSAPPADPQ